MLTALALSIAQLGDPRVLRLLVRRAATTLLALAVLGLGAWWLLDQGMARFGAVGSLGGLGGFAGEGVLRGALALVAVVIAGWLAWRLVAFAVLQFHADAVVEAVEARYYPAALAAARPLGWRAELRRGLAGALRALAWNLAALPIALVLLVTGIGVPLLFWALNAVLLGRELTDMVWLRQGRPDLPPSSQTQPSQTPPSLSPATLAPPLSARERLTLGAIISALTFVPVVNLLAPFLGAAMAAHLIHRKTGVIHAT